MIKALIQSFYSPIPYAEVAHRHRRILGVILLLLLIQTISQTFSINRSVQDANLYALFDDVVAQMPTMTWQDSELSIDKDEPYIIRSHLHTETFGDAPLVVFDNTGEVTFDNPQGAFALVTKDYVHLFAKRGEVKSHHFKTMQMGDLVMTPADFNVLVEKGKEWMWPILFFGGLFVGLLGFIVYALILAVIGLIGNAVLPAQLTFGQLFRLAFVAMAPMILLQALMTIIGIGPVSFWLDMLMTFLYLTFGVKAAANTNAA